MTLEDQIYSLLCPEGADPGTCNWARKTTRQILELLREPDDAIIDRIYDHCWKVKMASEDSNIGFMHDAWRAIFDGIMGKAIEDESLNDSPESVNVD